MPFDHQQTPSPEYSSLRYYSPGSNDALRRALDLERDLHGAIEREELEMLFQPQVDVASGKWVGAETLLRWVHPRHGWIAPADFIPIAESGPLIQAIGAWTLFRACDQLVRWEQERGLRGLRVSVNISACQFQRQFILQQVLEALDESGIEPCRLTLELKEGILASASRRSIETLLDLQRRGVRIALDDFGMGGVFPNCVLRVPLQQLKIDRSIVHQLPRDPNARAATCTLIALAQNYFNTETLAEGVETPEQAEYLAGQGCTLMQGYHFGRPMTAQAFAASWHNSRK